MDAVYFADGEVKFGDHEYDLRACMNTGQALAKQRVRRLGYEQALRSHYLTGAPHPHDENYPLDQWDKIS